PFVDGLEGQATLGCQLLASPFDLLTCEGADEVGFDPQLALGRPAGMSVPDQLLGAPLKGVANLGAEPAGGERAAIAADELAVEPGRAIAGHLPVEVVGAEDANLGLASL